jgi:long-chain acyl-CoA synthetase
MEQHHSIARASLGYGMSEVASAACTELNRYYGKAGSVGIPLCKVNIKAVDTETLQEQPFNKEGELYISTPGLMVHYLNNEAETNATIFTDENGVRWIKTGDLGYIDEDGFVFITGKLKRIYTTRTDAKGAIFHIFPDFHFLSCRAVRLLSNPG